VIKFKTPQISAHHTVLTDKIQNMNKKTTIWLAAILIAGFLAILPGYNAPAYLDDGVAMNQTRELAEAGNSIPEMLLIKEPYGFFRPTKTLVFALVAAGTEIETDPRIQPRLAIARTIGYLNYLFSGLGVFLLCRRLSKDNTIALTACAIWLFSPSVIGPSTWVSAQNIPLALGFVLMALTFADKAYTCSKYRIPLSLGAMFFYAAGLISYDTAIGFLPLVASIYLFRNFQPETSPDHGVLRKILQKSGVILPAIAVTGGWLVVRHLLGATTHAGSTNALYPPDATALQVFAASAWFHWRLFLMWIWPFGNLELVGTYIPGKSTSSIAIASAWLLLTGILLAAATCLWTGYRKSNHLLKFLGIAILLGFAATIPSGNYIPVYAGPLGDYYTAFPAAGWSMAAATILILLFRKAKTTKSWIPITLVTLLIAHRIILGQYVPQRAMQFNKPGEVERLSIQTRPFQYMQQKLLAAKLYTKGNRAEAITLMKEAITTAPWLTRLQYGQILEQEGNLIEAEKQYDIEIAKGDENTLAYAGHRKILFLESRSEYTEICKLAEKVLPDLTYPYHHALTASAIRAAAKSGDFKTAKTWLEKANRIYPGSPIIKKVDQEEKISETKP
jgi:hypothetical protein